MRLIPTFDFSEYLSSKIKHLGEYNICTKYNIYTIVLINNSITL